MLNLTTLKTYLDTADSKAVKVLMYLLEIRTESGRIHTTIDTVSCTCNVSKATVNKVFKKLYDKNLLNKVRNSTYILNLKE